MTAIEMVWERIKLAARDHARSGRPLDVHNAEALIVGLLRQEHVTPWPPPDIIEFYAQELLAFIERDRLTAR